MAAPRTAPAARRDPAAAFAPDLLRTVDAHWRAW
jgi:hypothetical protein